MSAWFVWDEGAIVVPSKPHAQKVRNVARDPHVMIAIGDPNDDFDVDLIEGEAELPPSTTEGLAEMFARKYSAKLASAGASVEAFLAIYSQPIRIRPTRRLGWGGRGWGDQAVAAAVG